MTLFFPNTVQAALRKQAVGAAFLGRLDFPGGEKRLWLGSGRVNYGGEWWEGTGELVSLSSIASGAADAALPVTFTLSGVDDDIYALAISADPSEIRGRAATLYIQFFSPATMRPYDDPVAIWSGTMDRMTATRSVEARSVSLICEGLFADRSRSPNGLYTDRDQQARSPGDLFFQYVATRVNRTVQWP